MRDDHLLIRLDRGVGAAAAVGVVHGARAGLHVPAHGVEGDGRLGEAQLLHVRVHVHLLLPVGEEAPRAAGDPLPCVPYHVAEAEYHAHDAEGAARVRGPPDREHKEQHLHACTHAHANTRMHVNVMCGCEVTSGIYNNNYYYYISITLYIFSFYIQLCRFTKKNFFYRSDITPDPGGHRPQRPYADMCKTGSGAGKCAGAKSNTVRRRSNHARTEDQAGKRKCANIDAVGG